VTGPTLSNYEIYYKTGATAEFEYLDSVPMGTEAYTASVPDGPLHIFSVATVDSSGNRSGFSDEIVVQELNYLVIQDSVPFELDLELPNRDGITCTSDPSPLLGTLSGGCSTTLSYQPNSGEAGVDSFEVVGFDGADEVYRGIVAVSIVINIEGNHAPTLEWVDEPGFVTDGVNPDSGTGGTAFTFKVKYTDLDNEYPYIANLWIDVDGDGLFEEPSERFDMGFPVNPDFAKNGLIYELTIDSMQFSPGAANISYYFDFRNYIAGGTQVSAWGPISAVDPDGAVNGPDLLQTFGLSIDKTSWNLGTVGIGSKHSPVEPFLVTNTGDGDQTYSLAITDIYGGLLPGLEIAPDTFVLRALFCGTGDAAPEASHFQFDDIVTGSSAGADVFGSPFCSANGSQVPAGEQRALWFQFEAPTELQNFTTNSIEVTVSAQSPQ
jgi:hypothetical protein